jgi:hypothetical protein
MLRNCGLDSVEAALEKKRNQFGTLPFDLQRFGVPQQMRAFSLCEEGTRLARRRQMRALSSQGGKERQE